MSKELRVFLAIVLASFLTVAGCSQESRDAVGDAASEISEDVGDAAEAAGEPLPRVEETFSPERVLLFRHPRSNLAVFYRATEDLLFALKLAYDDVSLEIAAATAKLPIETVEGIVDYAITIGLIVASPSLFEPSGEPWSRH